MADGCRRFKFLKGVFTLIVFYLALDLSTEGAGISPNLENVAVYEGYSSIMNLTADLNNTRWIIIPTSDEFGTYTISDYGGYRDPSLTGLFYLNQSGLVILDATTAPNGEGPISTAGLYIAQCSNDDNRTAAKLLVVRSPPVCLCNASSSSASQLLCSIVYADGTLHPLNANITWKFDDVVYTTDTPPRTRIDEYTFQSTSTIMVDNSFPQNFACTVAFNEPTDIVYDFIATNAPEFSASCSVAVCGLATNTQPPTTEPPTTTSGYCFPNMKNIAIREGTLDVTMNVTASPCGVNLVIFSTTNEPYPQRILGSDCTVYQTLANLYYVNQSGLIIRISTTTENGHPISTAGLYMADCGNTGSPTEGAKLLVVHSGPDCSCLRYNSSSNVDLSCKVSFADSTIHPISAIMTWIVNGAYYTTDTPAKNKTDEYVYTATSTITLDANTVYYYQCVLTFGEPTDIQYVWIATNAPEYTASCSVPENANGTTQTTILQPTENPPISMEPLFGPVAGGTHLTIIIGSATIDYISRYIGSNIWDVRHVYFGEHLSSTLVSLQSRGSSTFEFLAVTPNTTESSTRQPLSVVIEFSPTLLNLAPFNMTSDKTFTYLPNPEITDIYPNNFITSGGTLLDIFGQSLSSVAKPIIQLKIIITRAAEDGSTPNRTTTTTSRVCTVPPGNDTYMQCPMPPLNLPEDLLEIINSLYNTTVTRRRRSRNPVTHLIANSHTLLSRFRRDLNVLTVNGSNGRDQAEIFLGFILDGYREYENINDAFPDTKLLFYSAPEINSSDELIQFEPSEDELIYVKGRYMSRGCRLIDYVVHIGSEICTNSDLQANQLSCRPPKVEPSLTLNDTIYCGGSGLSMTVSVGYKQYQYSCLTYRDRSRRLALIVGLTVGLGGFVILLIVLIVCIVKCRRKKVSQESDIHQNSGERELGYRYDKNVEQPESQQSCKVIRTRQSASIYKPDDDYAKGLQLESRQDYDRQIEDDDIKPNDEYSNFYGVDRN